MWMDFTTGNLIWLKFLKGPGAGDRVLRPWTKREDRRLGGGEGGKTKNILDGKYCLGTWNKWDSACMESDEKRSSIT